jgi:peptide/nickel transport system substrate-binding protein
MSNYFIFRYRRSSRRWRRFMRLSRKRVTTYIDRHIWGKWHQLRLVRRFLILWWLVLAVGGIGSFRQLTSLSHANQVESAVSGGTFTEAAIGTVKILNPILPESSPASSIDRLVFSGLTRYNAARQLEPDLATKWTVSPDGRVYTFKLRHGVKWHDGVPFTATDVAFTVAAIQNPDSRSPLASSWQGVTVATVGDDTVSFTLPAPLDSFLDSTTLGIVPRHLLEQVEPSALREADFNRHPVGTGPFELNNFAPSADEVQLTANKYYYFGRPKLDNFNFHFYESSRAALTAYTQHQVTSPGVIAVDDLKQAAKSNHLLVTNLTLPVETTLFFDTTATNLNDAAVRTIISRALNRNALLLAGTGGGGQVITQPLLPGQIGYSAKYAPAALTIANANAALDAAGWGAKADGVRQKDGQSLKLTLATTSGGELETVARAVAAQLSPLGIKVDVKAVSLDELQQSYMRPRNFQMLLFGVNVGADPDVYAFWHSSQSKDPGVNLSQYNSAAADSALESARIRTDPAIRAAKYDAFLKAWNTDSPAAVLYEPAYRYGLSDTVMGFTARSLVTAADRYYGVEQWTVHQKLRSAH